MFICNLIFFILFYFHSFENVVNFLVILFCFGITIFFKDVSTASCNFLFSDSGTCAAFVEISWFSWRLVSLLKKQRKTLLLPFLSKEWSNENHDYYTVKVLSFRTLRFLLWKPFGINLVWAAFFKIFDLESFVLLRPSFAPSSFLKM